MTHTDDSSEYTTLSWSRALRHVALFALICGVGLALATFLFAPAFNASAKSGFGRESATIYAAFSILIGMGYMYCFWDLLLYRSGMLSLGVLGLSLGSIWGTAFAGVLLAHLFRPLESGQLIWVTVAVAGFATAAVLFKARGEFGGA